MLNPLLERGNNVDHVSACSFGRHDWKILHVVLTLQPSKSKIFFLKEVDCQWMSMIYLVVLSSK